jgi:hypothetical protein
MNLKRLFFWGALFAMLLAYVALFDRPRLEQVPLPPPLPEQFARVFQLDVQDVRAVEVRSGESRVTVVRDGDTWRVEEPPGNLLAGESLDSFIAAVVDTVVVEVVDESPAHVDQYGLMQPDVTLSVYLQGTDSPQVLQVGHTAPSGVSLYARRKEQERVLLVGSYLRFSIRTLLERVNAAAASR